MRVVISLSEESIKKMDSMRGKYMTRSSFIRMLIDKQDLEDNMEDAPDYE